MVVKFLSKYILEVIPSIVATVIGAYIVTHYINAKPDADKPKAAVAMPAQKPDTILPKAAKLEPAKAEPAKSESVKPETAKNEPSEKSSDTASTPSEQRRHQPQLREKAISKAAPVEKAAPAAAPAETAAKEDDRDANEIARAAIERLRKSDPAQQVEAPRAQPRVSVTYQPTAPAPIQQPQISAPQIQAAPVPASQGQPPVANVVPPLPEVSVAPAPQPVARIDNDPSRPMPPADIPQRPLDIRARQGERTTVAEDVVSAAKSMFHAVIPGTH